MDAELRLLLFDALRFVQREKHLDLTPYAVTLITVMIEAIADQTTGRERMSETPGQAQRRAIELIPGALALVSRTYSDTQVIDGSMLLTLMPRFMSNFCPPFENPPNY
jgi:hypothetical protein